METNNNCDYPTPLWVCEALIERFFPDLDDEDFVVEPSCGPGRFLQAIPANVPAMGVEIDPVRAEEARRNTGRPIITGDFRTVPLDVRPTAIITNPPFRVRLIESFLERAHALLPHEGRLGMLLPAYFFQTAARVAEYARSWSIEQTMIPRDIYHGIRLPLVFALFSKSHRRTLVGFALYSELVAVRHLAEEYQELARAGAGGRSAWRSVFEGALRSLGGEASLEELYRVVQGRRPTATAFWKEKIRQMAQRHGVRVGRGRYALSRQDELVLAA
jgi:hypothetical protein